ncbi:MAG TPA: autotransporter domain-containing protein, partial [Roseomonas sp.]
GFHETGAGGLNLHVGTADQTNLRVTPSMEVGQRIDLASSTSLRLFANAGVSFQTADRWRSNSYIEILGSASSFSTSTRMPSTYANLSVGADLLSGDSIELKAEYNVRAASNYLSHQGTLRMAYRF